MNIYLKLFWVFLKIGTFAFGGGYGMIPVMKQEVVNQGWLTEDAFLDIVGLSESTPGPIAVNMATYVGTTLAGFWGGLIATIGAILPAFLIIYFIAKIMQKFADNKYISSFLSGVKPVVVGFIVAVGITMILKNLKVMSGGTFTLPDFDVRALIISAIVAAIAIIPKEFFKKKIPTAVTILISAALGMIIYAI